MNYLGHAWISYLRRDSDIDCVGNVVGDALGRVRPRIDPAGSVYGRGLLLHRRVDTFCDSHPNTRECLALLRVQVPRGASIVIDVAYDHFLAAFLGHAVDEVIAYTNACISSAQSSLPEPADMTALYIVKDDRLRANHSVDGVEETLRRIAARRPALPLDAKRSTMAIVQKYDELAEISSEFFQSIEREFTRNSSHLVK